jgi:hypothetical protein
MADCAALKAADLGKDATLKPLFKTLRTDVKAMEVQLDGDRLAQSAATLKDESNIVTDRLNILNDKGNKTKEAADHAQLLTDIIQLQTDDVAGLTARLGTRTSDFTQISADLTAITTAIESDTGASPALVAAVNKFVTDRGTFLSTISGDIQNLINDRGQLIKDLTAMESQT